MDSAESASETFFFKDSSCTSTSVSFDTSVIARRKRMEIRRFKKLSVFSSVRDGSFSGIHKRARPLLSFGSSCDCFSSNDGSDGFAGLAEEADLHEDLALAPGFVVEVVGAGVLPQTFAASAALSSLHSGNPLTRSKSFPPEGWHRGKCILRICKASRSDIVVGQEGRVATLVSHGYDGGSLKGSGRHAIEKQKQQPVVFDEPKQPQIVDLPSSSGGVTPDLLVDPSAGQTVTSTNEQGFERPSSCVVAMDTDSGCVEGARIGTDCKPPTVLQKLRGACPSSAKVLICGRRREMEDSAVIVPSFVKFPCQAVGDCFCRNKHENTDLHLFAVYDGHGGHQASNYCAERLHHALAEELSAISPMGSSDDALPFSWEKVITSCFLKLDKEVGGVCPYGVCDDVDSSATCCTDTIAPENVGTTASVVLLNSCQIIVANCGDSRAVLSQGGKAIALSRDHKPERSDEMSRIEAAGGHVIYWDGYRVGGLLALSRAIGDRFLKRYVISEPDVTCLQRCDEDECLIIASDGLWDVMSNETACEVARKYLATARRKGDPRMFPPGEDPASSAAAAILVKLAYGRGSKDNISAVVIDLKARYK